MTAACPDLGCDNRRVSPQVLDMRCIIDVTHVTHDDQGLDGREDSTTSFSTIFDHVPPRRDASSGCAADPGPSGLNPRNLPLSDGTRLLQVLPRCVKKSLSSTRLVSPSQASAIEQNLLLNLKPPIAALRESGPFPVLRSGTSADQGPRSSMEDAHLQLDRCEELGDWAEGEGRAFYGVFDGHGGTGAASFVQAHILRHLADGISRADIPIKEAFEAAYDRTDREFEAACAANQELHSGTTAIAVLISGRSLVVANAGDCRAVLCQAGKAVALSVDHTTTSEIERTRIVAAGGVVDSENYLNGQLGVARAIGDFHHEGLKSRCDLDRSSGPLICNPDVLERELEEEDEFLIVGCDGLWDVFTSSDAVRFARIRLQDHNNPEQCSRELVEEALRRNTSDNLTVITVCLSSEKPKQLESKWRPKRCVSVDGLSTLQRSLME